MFRLRHRHALALPFVLLALATVVGGLANGVDARARVVDDLTDDPVKDAVVHMGERVAVTDAKGEFTLPAVPRTANLVVDAQGYARQKVPTTIDEVRESPLSLTLYAYDGTKTETDRIKSPQARDQQNSKVLAQGNDGGQIVLVPHPGRDAKILLCADGFDAKLITAHGVLQQIPLQPGSNGCAPLPTAAPAPPASGSPGASPAASPSPAASRSPSPSP